MAPPRVVQRSPVSTVTSPAVVRRGRAASGELTAAVAESLIKASVSGLWMPGLEDAEAPEPALPGPRGDTGLTGPSGAPGPTGPILIGLDGEDADAHPFIGVSDDDTGVVPYTPTWDQNISSPTLGDATLTGLFRRRNGRVTFQIDFTFGGSSSSGSGLHNFTLPSTPKMMGPCTVVVTDVGTAAYLGNGVLFGSNAIGIVGDALAGTWFTESSPFTWAVGDKFAITGSYEE